MKRIVTCSECGATTTPNKWRALGWLKVETTYNDGNRWRQYMCAKCREGNKITRPCPLGLEAA